MITGGQASIALEWKNSSLRKQSDKINTQENKTEIRDVRVCVPDTYIHIQGSPSGCGRREMPGVSQVEKEHVVPIEAGRSSGVIHWENGREVVSRNTYGSLGIFEAWGYGTAQRKA